MTRHDKTFTSCPRLSQSPMSEIIMSEIIMSEILHIVNQFKGHSIIYNEPGNEVNKTQCSAVALAACKTVSRSLKTMCVWWGVVGCVYLCLANGCVWGGVSFHSETPCGYNDHHVCKKICYTD